jgi:hypothetical protein
MLKRGFACTASKGTRSGFVELPRARAEPRVPGPSVRHKAERIEGAEPQPTRRIVFGERRVAADAMNMRAIKERDGARAVERECAGNRAGGRREIMTQLQKGNGRNGKCRRIL